MIVRFGPFSLDSARRQVLRGNAAIHLTPKAFDLIHLLVTDAPRVVSKRELHERLWPGTFVSDASLTGLIKELRRELDDRTPDSPVIRTVHGVGYACAADVHVSSPRPRHAWHWLALNGRRVTLREGENVIGRDPEAHVWLDAAGVSRRHARILIEEGGVRLEDLGSKNGTTVRTCPVQGYVSLRDGDQIVFASTPSVYRVSSAGMSTETRSRASRARGARAASTGRQEDS